MTSDLESTARALVRPGKGILAADESTPTIAKRFASISVTSTEETRKAYREILFTARAAAEFVSGVILFDETIRQSASDGTPFPRLLADQGILPGIKVDRGAKPLALVPGEKVTEGLDGLRDRLADYVELGARFTKWRAVITIGDGKPTEACLHVNAHALGRFAALSQEAGLVPIVEPEVLMDGDHSIDRCEEVTTHVLQTVFGELALQCVHLEGMLLKPNMVLPGASSSATVDDAQIASATVRTLRRAVPAAVPGIVFLSGGQSDVAATSRLNEMNRVGPHPWELSFSYGRALQAPALAAWGGQATQVEAAREAYVHRARMNGAARSGSWTETLESQTATA